MIYKHFKIFELLSLTRSVNSVHPEDLHSACKGTQTSSFGPLSLLLMLRENTIRRVVDERHRASRNEADLPRDEGRVGSLTTCAPDGL